jgi:hypothetical protein
MVGRLPDVQITGRNGIPDGKGRNGLGNLTKISYAKLSQATSAVYHGDGAVFPVTDYSGPLTVVSSVQYDNGLISMNTQNYYYEE